VTPLAKLLEAALFASARPIATEELAVLEPDASPAELQAALEELREHYDVDGHGVELQELGGGWQILTRAEYTEAIERAQLAARPARLSGAALETLAIIAYRQPISRLEIEEIRGVMVGSVLKSLHERGLIDVTGRGEGLGRPLLYGTTPVFLEYFGLRHLEELPRGDELAIALRAPDRPDAPPPPAVAPVADRDDRADRAVDVPSTRERSTVAEESRPESVETTADVPGLAEAGV
jgi:segregation and condensation protein B